MNKSVLVQEKASYAKVEPPCVYFGTCGGCALQDLAYPDQLALKQARLSQALAGVEGFALPMDVEGLEDPWRYRNKAELTFGGSGGALTLGYHAAGSYWNIVDLHDCLLLPEPAARMLEDVRRLATDTGLPAYHPRTHQGVFRYLLVRSSHATGKVLLCLMTASHPDACGAVERMGVELMRRHPHIASVYWGRTDKLADIAVPDELVLLGGDPYLEERVGPFQLELHPLSFLQPATVQADRMYRYLVGALPQQPADIAWDLYCGLGLIGLYLAGRFQKVYGIDVEPHHLELARRNASRNGLHNIEFRAGKVETLLMDRRFWLDEARPDAVVVDPPRAGLHPQAIASLLAARPATIAYCSCNVQSLARDLQLLLTGFPRYRVVEARAFDMFPQTNHVELLAILSRS